MSKQSGVFSNRAVRAVVGTTLLVSAFMAADYTLSKHVTEQQINDKVSRVFSIAAEEITDVFYAPENERIYELRKRMSFIETTQKAPFRPDFAPSFKPDELVNMRKSDAEGIMQEHSDLVRFKMGKTEIYKMENGRYGIKSVEGQEKALKNQITPEIK